ncbi:hypothetical protein ILYODFUR_005758 [Ilyodon furcidens]|uniref:Uncharacterized protein n=1 Tax=Ilyodon furcidens TaxID=33524 RepID=A0ABV0UTA3_9TELE
MSPYQDSEKQDKVGGCVRALKDMNETNLKSRGSVLSIRSLRHLESITGTPLSMCRETQGKSEEEEESGGSVKGSHPPHHPWIEESCYYYSNNVNASPRLTRNYEISHKCH